MRRPRFRILSAFARLAYRYVDAPADRPRGPDGPFPCNITRPLGGDLQFLQVIERPESAAELRYAVRKTQQTRHNRSFECRDMTFARRRMEHQAGDCRSNSECSAFAGASASAIEYCESRNSVRSRHRWLTPFSDGVGEALVVGMVAALLGRDALGAGCGPQRPPEVLLLIPQATRSSGDRCPAKIA